MNDFQRVYGLAVLNIGLHMNDCQILKKPLLENKAQNVYEYKIHIKIFHTAYSQIPVNKYTIWKWHECFKLTDLS